MTTATPLLFVDNVSMHFGGLKAVDGVSITVAAHQVVGLIGPNGSGKSTLINVISRIYEPTGGSVKIDNKEIAGVAVHDVAGLGITRTFQNVRLFPTMTVRDNLRMGTTSETRTGFVASGLALPSARREDKATDGQVEDVAVLLGLESQLDRVSGDLPYGLQKLTELGRALVSNPKLILLDEPVAGMNSYEKKALVVALNRVRSARPVAFLLVEHDMAFVMSLTEYLYVLNFGKLIAQGTPEQVRADPGVIEAYLGAGHASD